MLLNKNIVKFTARVILFFMPVFGVFLALVGLGMSAGELWRTDRVVSFEIEHPGETLFLRRILQDNANYKLKKLVQLKPDVFVLGSSRVMQFRKEMFGDVTFYNAGGLVDAPSRFQDVLELLPEDYNPKMVILGMDSFEFGKKRKRGGSVQIERAEYFTATNWRPYVFVAQRLVAGIIEKPSRLFEYLNPVEPIYGKTAIGVMALDGNGFRSDGSFQYGTYILSHRADPSYIDSEDPPIIERVRKGIAQFEFDSDFDAEKAVDLRNFLFAAKSKNIYVVGVAPPYSGEVQNELSTSPHHRDLFRDFRREIPKIFAEAGYPFYDFTDLHSLGLDDRSMFDGFHPTETAAAAMLEKIFTSREFRKAPLPDIRNKAGYLKERLSDPLSKPFEIKW